MAVSVNGVSLADLELNKPPEILLAPPILMPLKARGKSLPMKPTPGVVSYEETVAVNKAQGIIWVSSIFLYYIIRFAHTSQALDLTKKKMTSA